MPHSPADRLLRPATPKAGELTTATQEPASSTDPPTEAPDPTNTPAPTATPPAPGEFADVVEVVDGDTIKVNRGRGVETVRYIGIDTPETRDPNSPVECYGAEATAANSSLVAGARVRLEKDVSETDRFGRLLRYVWVDDVMVNERLVADGYAVSSTYPPDVKYQERFVAAQGSAREAGRGLWAQCGGADTPLAPVQQPDSNPIMPEPSGCDPSYPDVCIPPPPPDLDCPEIPYRNFRVVGADPHRFDGDRDGVGCET